MQVTRGVQVTRVVQVTLVASITRGVRVAQEAQLDTLGAFDDYMEACLRADWAAEKRSLLDAVVLDSYASNGVSPVIATGSSLAVTPGATCRRSSAHLLATWPPWEHTCMNLACATWWAPMAPVESLLRLHTLCQRVQCMNKRFRAFV
jgi:hypothetical protein